MQVLIPLFQIRREELHTALSDTRDEMRVLLALRSYAKGRFCYDEMVHLGDHTAEISLQKVSNQAAHLSRRFTDTRGSTSVAPCPVV